jgi:O-antigen/teichoic acid export membrane protein
VPDLAHPASPNGAIARDLCALPGSAGERHFSTAHLLGRLKTHTISSTFVTTLAQACIFALTMGSTMVLARLLTPADFGLVALVMMLTGFLRTFKNAGLSSATIQRESITHAQVSNLFWLNLILGAAAAGVLALTAPVAAWFFREPRLIAITLAISITFLVEGAMVQHMALLNRQMRFRAIAMIQVISTGGGAAVGIAVAWLYRSYWALVWLQMIVPLIALALTWSASRWRPQRPVRNTGTRPLLAFGANLTASSFVYSVASSADSLLIGRFYGAGPVGLYTRAAALLRRPLDQLLAPINAVFIPVLARLQSEPARYRRTFLRVYEPIVLVTLFVTGLCFALAQPLTRVVLGAQWMDAVPMVAAFSIAAMVAPLAATCSWLFESQGRGRHSLITSSLSSTIAIASFVAGLPFGIAGVALAYSISSVGVQLPLFFHHGGRTGPVTTADLWSGLLRHLPLWPVVSGTTFFSARLLADVSAGWQLAGGSAGGVLAGMLFIFASPASRRPATMLLGTVLEWLQSRRGIAANLAARQPV